MSGHLPGSRGPRTTAASGRARTSAPRSPRSAGPRSPGARRRPIVTLARAHPGVRTVFGAVAPGSRSADLARVNQLTRRPGSCGGTPPAPCRFQREETLMTTAAERLGGESQGDTQSLRQVALASFVGTTVEWYDFFLYGTAAALIFDKLFFPNVDPTIGTLAAFATFGVGFAARPIGGIVFGHFGDRVGRKSMLVISLLIMGLATAAIGILPSYGTIGIAAPIILVVLRLAQGLGVGGEWGGAVLMSVEHAPKGKRGLYGSFPQMGVPAGLLGATAIFAATQALTTESQFTSYGWGVPFLFSIVLVAVGLVIRTRLMESPAFQEVKDSGTEAPKPIVDVVKTHPREVLVAMGMRISENGIFY